MDKVAEEVDKVAEEVDKVAEEVDKVAEEVEKVADKHTLLSSATFLKYSPIVPHNNLYRAVKTPSPDPSLSPSTKAVLRQAGQGEVSRAISREIDTMAKRPTRRGENN